MSYEKALTKAWEELSRLTGEGRLSLKFLADEYEVSLDGLSVFSLACNIPAGDHASVMILHYLIKKLRLKVLPEPTGEWIGFRELEGGDGYYPAFKKRTIDVVLRKYGSSPEALIEAAGRLNGHDARIGDAGVVIEAFEKVPILITIWKGDEEVKPGANIAFDRSIREIFCTEDIVVLAEIIAHQL
ncbi:MAG: DUF3786 domain-containing protein [Candidatus Omnitrophota bacterium]|nr:DUF3786 domain-containing protein [Candidatus Omnitrophota bacterium]